MFIVISYDIPNDKRRERLRKMLMRYGDSVQRSVVEFDITQKQFDEIRAAGKKIIKPAEDDVRYYKFCANCEKQVEVIGNGKQVKNLLVYVA
jgi:CRISPR-associated protein Cas2